ncbi:MAG: DUF4160 domain-containing protein [Acholeplasmatales bacterium]|nr:DUF4160 domain-containing protein [Acholeplasmatales bacterium]
MNDLVNIGRVFSFCLILTLGDIYPIIKMEGDEELPTISSFYGIFILMHLTRKEHNPPHIHAIYGDYEATFYIEDGEIYNGEFPKNGKVLVKEFILKYKNELKEMWDKEVYKKLPPLQ